jgi:hypothetical protein
MKLTIILAVALFSISAQAQTNCAQNDNDCWFNNSVSLGTNEIVSVTVLKDLDPGADWMKVQTTDGTCIVGGLKLTAGMSTTDWQFQTYSHGWDANEGPFNGGFDITIPNANGGSNWFSMTCTSYKHWVQPEQFQEAVAGILNLTFKVQQ